MGIEWFRDLAICILGLGVTAVAVFIGILAFMLYRKLAPILNSVKRTSKTVENISSCMEEEVSKPLAQLASFVQGITQAFSLVRKFVGGKKGE